MKEYVIDLKGKVLGRAASEVAAVLSGKKEIDYAPNKVSNLKVKVFNADDLRISGRKEKQKEYQQYSGYPGGLRKTKMGALSNKKGMDFIFKKTVFGMLPKNKLRSKMILNLVFSKNKGENVKTN